MKSFNNFVQSALKARREQDENPNLSVVAETMKLLTHSFYGYQIMNRNRHSVKKNLSVEKTHGPINRKKFRCLGVLNEQLYEVERGKSDIEQTEPTIVVVTILQYAKLKVLEL